LCSAFGERRPSSERVLAPAVPGDWRRADADHQQLLVAQLGQRRRVDDGRSFAGVPTADRRDGMQRHRQLGQLVVPNQHQQHDQRHAGSRCYYWCWSGRPGRRRSSDHEETGGLSAQSRATGEAGEQIDQDVSLVPLQKQQRYENPLNLDLSPSFSFGSL